MTNQELIFRMFVAEFMGRYYSEYAIMNMEEGDLLHKVCDFLREER